MPYVSETQSPFKAEYANFLVASQIEEDLSKINKPEFERIIASRPEQAEDLTRSKVCIIGAGMSGLYSAMLLEKAGIPYEILEASTRPGGRVLTHYFSDQPHDYYDIGAMRFPKTPIMDRTFDLFKRTGVNKRLVPYFMKAEQQPTRYNDITVVGDQTGDPFHVSEKNHGPVPDANVDNADRFLDEAYAPFREKIKAAVKSGHPTQLREAWHFLMDHDTRSLRDYLQYKMGLDVETIHWLETTQSATGWFNQAFTENVMESLAFEYFDKNEPLAPGAGEITGKDGKPLIEGNWYCVEGGTTQLTNVLAKLFNSHVSYGKRVTKMQLLRSASESEVEVTVYGETTPRRYAAIINTTTLGALQKIDLTQMELTYRAKAAIRSLHYDTSTKVGMKFKSAWWINKQGIKGGLGKTDMPLRVCVYPSYNLEDKDEAVLLCSYAWGQDAERVAAYINDSPAEQQVELKQLMIYNLARLHSQSEKEFPEMYQLISEQYISHHAYDWSKDINAAGAFALFSPGDFSQHYPSLVRPTSDGRFYVVGEAASAHHAWIVGSLDSAMRGVTQMLHRFKRDDLKEMLEKEFGKAHEMDESTLDHQINLSLLTPEEARSVRL